MSTTDRRAVARGTDRRRKPCKVCGHRPRASQWQPTCGEATCRLTWAPAWRPSPKGS